MDHVIDSAECVSSSASRTLSHLAPGMFSHKPQNATLDSDVVNAYGVLDREREFVSICAVSFVHYLNSASSAVTTAVVVYI